MRVMIVLFAMATLDGSGARERGVNEGDGRGDSKWEALRVEMSEMQGKVENAKCRNRLARSSQVRYESRKLAANRSRSTTLKVSRPVNG